MQSKLSDLVDNLSEINKKECPECIKWKIKSECEFIGFKNDRLHYRCKKCKIKYTKSKDGLTKKFLPYINFAMVNFINLLIVKKRRLSLWIYG